MSPTDRAELAKKARLGNFAVGQVLFTRGEQARTALYLLSGEVELYNESGTRLVKAGTPDARHPLSPGGKRATTATVIKPAQVLFIDADQLDLMLTWSQTGSMEVVEIDGSGDEGNDWASAFLQSEAFHRIPPANIAQIFAAMKPVEFKAGQLVIRQGDPGDYYYVITAGTCRIIRREADGRVAELNRIGVGQGFGEEALVSGDPRNASVLAATDVSLMRIAAEEFTRLLRTPLLREIAVEEIAESAQLLDVRLPDEFRRGRLPGAINLPLSKLREQAAQLQPGVCYVVYCDTGRRSASATYLLCERGHDARLLAGGVAADEMPVRG